MPSFNQHQHASWRDSWPPVQMRLPRSQHGKDSADNMLRMGDHDPLEYFLSPDEGFEDDDKEEQGSLDAYLEAGITASPSVRSISPSSLRGMCESPGRLMTPPPPTPRLSPLQCAMDFDEDDDEEYIRLTPDAHLLQTATQKRPMPRALSPRPTHRKFSTNIPRQASPTRYVADLSESSFSSRLSASAPHNPINTTPIRPPLGRLFMSWPSHHRSTPHAWRQPSFDVWSIAEEPEDMDEMRNIVRERELVMRPMRPQTPQPRLRYPGNMQRSVSHDGVRVQKKVRFAWPLEEEIP